MDRFLSHTYHNLVYSALCMLVILLLKKPLLKRNLQTVYFYLWLIPIFVFFNPFSIIVSSDTWGIKHTFFVSTAPRCKAIVYGLLSCWGIGSIITSIRYFISKREAASLFLCGLRPATEQIDNMLVLCKNELKIKKTVKIGISEHTQTPIIFHAKVPYIVLPDIEWKPLALRMVLLHELHHFRSRDGFIKWLGHVVHVLFWWNPASYLMARQMEDSCEWACDERVLHGRSQEEQDAYMQTVLNFAKRAAGQKKIVGVVSLSSSAFEQRFSLMLKVRQVLKKPMAFRVMVAFVALILVLGSFLTLRRNMAFDFPGTIIYSEDFEVVKRFDGLYDIYDENGTIVFYGIDDGYLDIIMSLGENE